MLHWILNVDTIILPRYFTNDTVVREYDEQQYLLHTLQRTVPPLPPSPTVLPPPWQYYLLPPNPYWLYPPPNYCLLHHMPLLQHCLPGCTICYPCALTGSMNERNIQWLTVTHLSWQHDLQPTSVIPLLAARHPTHPPVGHGLLCITLPATPSSTLAICTYCPWLLPLHPSCSLTQPPLIALSSNWIS